jgi:hypothetical protein
MDFPWFSSVVCLGLESFFLLSSRYWFATRSDLTPTVRELGRLGRLSVNVGSWCSDKRSDNPISAASDWGPESLAEGNSGEKTGDADARRYTDQLCQKLIPVDTSCFFSLSSLLIHRSSQLPVLWVAQAEIQHISALKICGLRVRRQACSTWDRSRCSVHTTSMRSIRWNQLVRVLFYTVLFILEFWKSFWKSCLKIILKIILKIMSVLSEFLCQMVLVERCWKPSSHCWDPQIWSSWRLLAAHCYHRTPGLCPSGHMAHENGPVEIVDLPSMNSMVMFYGKFGDL